MWDTEPEFVVVGGGLEQEQLVLVMDTSASMLPGRPGGPDRAAAMQQAARRAQPSQCLVPYLHRRWILRELQSGLQLGLVSFSDEEQVVNVANLTTVTEQSRPRLAAKLDSLNFLGQVVPILNLTLLLGIHKLV